MNRLRAVLTVVAALCLASLAVVLAWRYIGSKTRIDTHQVAVAARNIDLGSALDAAQLQLIDWPRDSIPEGAFHSLEPLLNDPQTKAPRIARTSLMKGEPVLESRLAPIGSQGGLSAVIHSGNRAITVRVNDVVGVAGFALPGSFVDVLVNTTEPGAQNGISEASISKIVLDHILVLAAAQEVAREDAKPKVVNAVTLEVTPEQAERLDLARSVGTLSLVLRNPIDVGGTPSSGINKEQLLHWVTKPVSPSEERAPAAPTAAPPPPPPAPRRSPAHRPSPTDRVEVIRGTDRVHQDF